MDLLFDYLFDIEVPGPITENFGTVGFGTTFFFYNLGSLVLALFHSLCSLWFPKY